jgi:hypothetical protein
MVTSGGNAGAKEEAKKKITNAIIGFVIVLAAWLLIDTIMRGLLVGTSGEIDGRLWSQIECGSQAVPGLIKPPQDNLRPVASGGLLPSDVFTQLDAGGVVVTASGSCTDRSDPNCTGLGGVEQSTIDDVIELSNTCADCDITITGATEVGHVEDCYQDGTCVDISCNHAGGCNCQDINDIAKGAEANSSRVVFETVSCENKITVLELWGQEGITGEAYCPDDAGYGHITEDHFTLYSN